MNSVHIFSASKRCLFASTHSPRIYTQFTPLSAAISHTPPSLEHVEAALFFASSPHTEWASKMFSCCKKFASATHNLKTCNKQLNNRMLQLIYFLRAPFGAGLPVASIEPYLCTTSDSRPWTRGTSNRGKLSASDPKVFFFSRDCLSTIMVRSVKCP